MILKSKTRVAILLAYMLAGSVVLAIQMAALTPGVLMGLFGQAEDPRHFLLSDVRIVAFISGVVGLLILSPLVVMAATRQAAMWSDNLRIFKSRVEAMKGGAPFPGIEVQNRSDEMAEALSAVQQMALMMQSQIRELAQRGEVIEVERNRLSLLLQALGTGVAYLDERFEVLYINKSLAQMLDTTYPIAEQVGLSKLLEAGGVVKGQQSMLKDMVNEYFRNHELPIELRLSNGRILGIRFAVQNDRTEGQHAVLLAEDITDARSVQNLREEIERDNLTGVMNRKGFEQTLIACLNRLAPGEGLGVMFLDLDGFKGVNDTLGHKAGDQVLKASALILKSATRNIDAVARLGGDEFAIIIARCNRQLINNVADRIIESFAQDKLLKRLNHNHGLKVSCSIGGALYPEHGRTMSELVEISDAMMYEAKRAGKNCFRLAPAAGLDRSALKV